MMKKYTVKHDNTVKQLRSFSKALMVCKSNGYIKVADTLQKLQESVVSNDRVKIYLSIEKNSALIVNYNGDEVAERFIIDNITGTINYPNEKGVFNA